MSHSFKVILWDIKELTFLRNTSKDKGLQYDDFSICAFFEEEKKIKVYQNQNQK